MKENHKKRYIKFQTFYRMPWQKKGMFIINLCLLSCLKIIAPRMPYRYLSKYFGKSQGILVASTLISQEALIKSKAIKQSIALAVKYTPWPILCLPQAILAKLWCQYYQIPYYLFIGISPNRPHFNEAHAWVTAGPLAISGGYAFDSHKVISCYQGSLHTQK